ncbi:MAG: VWA domain-containing protein [Pyrinomonadaceae bacterium]
MTHFQRTSRFLIIFASLALCAAQAFGQAGRHPRPANESSSILNVVATRADDSSNSGEPLNIKQLSLYDGGIEQIIKSFTPDPSPARIVLLVDNSLTIRADVEKLEAAAREFAYEIYDGDKILIVGYDEQPEIVADWTDDAKKIEASLRTFRKKGDPHLFDALAAVTDQALTPFNNTGQKRVVVIVSDGLDRGSKTSFASILAQLQKQNITVYCMQATDRTGGALRRNQPKPTQTITQLAEGTGGRVLPITEPREAAKAICDELRKNRYLLAYTPSSIMYTDARRLLLLADEGINIRTKTMEPAR